MFLSRKLFLAKSLLNIHITFKAENTPVDILSIPFIHYTVFLWISFFIKTFHILAYHRAPAKNASYAACEAQKSCKLHTRLTIDCGKSRAQPLWILVPPVLRRRQATLPNKQKLDHNQKTVRACSNSSCRALFWCLPQVQTADCAYLTASAHSRTLPVSLTTHNQYTYQWSVLRVEVGYSLRQGRRGVKKLYNTLSECRRGASVISTLIKQKTVNLWSIIHVWGWRRSGENRNYIVSFQGE